MAIHTSLATAIDKGRLASTVVYVALLEMDILDPNTRAVTETLRFAHNTENYSFKGNTYLAMPFDFDVKTSKGELPTITLSIVDHSQAIQGRLQETNGGVDSPVRLLVVSTANTASAELTESFTVMSASCRSEDYSIAFTLGAENPLALRFPTRLFARDRCEWRFKGPRCGYTGPVTSCDFTRDGANGCVAKNNAINFGGFPGIRIRTYQ